MRLINRINERKIFWLIVGLACLSIISVSLYGVSWYQTCGFLSGAVNNLVDPSEISINAANVQQLAIVQSATGDMRYNVIFSPDNNLIVANGRPKPGESYSSETPTSCVTFWIWDVPKADQENSHLRTWNRERGNGQFIDTFEFTLSPDSRILVTDERSVIDLSTGTRIGTLGEKNLGLFTDTAFSQNHQIIATSDDQAIVLWDATSLKSIRIIPTDGQAVRKIIFLDNDLLISGGTDNIIRFWNTNNGNELSGFPVPIDDVFIVTDMDLSPDRKLLAVTTSDTGNAFIFDITHEKFISLNEGERYTQFSPDGSLLIMSNLAIAELLDTETGSKIAELTSVSERYESISVAFNPQNDLIALGNTNGEVQLWSTDGALLHVIHTNAGWVSDLNFNSTGTLLAVATRNEDTGEGQVQVYGINPSS